MQEFLRGADSSGTRRGPPGRKVFGIGKSGSRHQGRRGKQTTGNHHQSGPGRSQQRIETKSLIYFIVYFNCYTQISIVLNQ